MADYKDKKVKRQKEPPHSKHVASAEDPEEYHYTMEDLLQDINSLNEVAHSHSIVVVKDTFNKYPNRYLVYDDSGWGCQLFLNYKTNPNNEDFIRSHVSNELKVAAESITLECKGERIHQKYSPTAGINKFYDHRFYLAHIETFPKTARQDDFQIDGVSYHWRTMADLEADAATMKRNSDVIGFVKEMF